MTPSATAASIARDIAIRTAEPATLSRAIRAEREASTFSPSVQWRPHSLASGWAGTALLFGAMDASSPEEGWDVVGHEHLTAACAAVAELPATSSSLYGGLAGIGSAAVTLDRSRGRYRGLLARIDVELAGRVDRAVRRLGTRNGCGVGEFDLISGLSGTAVYLLARRTEPAAELTLRRLLDCLIGLVLDDVEPRRWYTPAALAAESMRSQFPSGSYNCGIAHGLAGVLALLSIAARADVAAERLTEAIDAAASWLGEHAVETEFGPDWPNAVSLVADRAPTALTSRASWCYGPPGVARALFLAGDALDERRYRDLAVRAMHGLLTRPHGLDSPTFCHGVAGLLHVVHRFAVDTADRRFEEAAESLLVEMIGFHDPDSILGFRNTEPGSVLVDSPGLLSGATGVALALSAATTAVPPIWDRLFLIG